MSAATCGSATCERRTDERRLASEVSKAACRFRWPAPGGPGWVLPGASAGSLAGGHDRGIDRVAQSLVVSACGSVERSAGQACRFDGPDGCLGLASSRVSTVTARRAPNAEDKVSGAAQYATP